jgi:hypothetical protein
MGHRSDQLKTCILAGVDAKNARNRQKADRMLAKMVTFVLKFILSRASEREYWQRFHRNSLDQNDATHYCPVSRLPHLGRFCSLPVLHIRSCRFEETLYRFKACLF